MLIIIFTILCAFSQPVFNKVQIEGSDLEQVANVDSYSGWISFAENNDVNIESYFTDYNQILGLGAHDKMELQKVKKTIWRATNTIFIARTIRELKLNCQAILCIPKMAYCMEQMEKL